MQYVIMLLKGKVFDHLFMLLIAIISLIVIGELGT